MEDEKLKISKKWLQQLAQGAGSPIDAVTSTSLQVELIQKGLIRCRFVVPDLLIVSSLILMNSNFLLFLNLLN